MGLVYRCSRRVLYNFLQFLTGTTSGPNEWVIIFCRLKTQKREGVENYNSLKALLFFFVVFRWGSTFQKIMGSPWKEGIVRLEADKALKMPILPPKKTNWLFSGTLKSSSPSASTWSPWPVPWSWTLGRQPGTVRRHLPVRLEAVAIGSAGVEAPPRFNLGQDLGCRYVVSERSRQRCQSQIFHQCLAGLFSLARP